MGLSADGRGRNYSPLRGLVEATLERLYFADWPGRAWGALPGRSAVDLLRFTEAVLPPGSPRLRLGFVSDLHVGPTTAPRALDRAMELLGLAEPDVLCLGGDLVFLEATPEKARRLAELVDRVPAAHKLAVWGNHDLWTFHERIEDALGEVGVRFLVNEAVRLPEPWGEVAVLGLDEPYTGAPDVEQALAACGDADVRLALCHAPEGAPLLAGRVALVLSGHTHGGQVALPGQRPLWVPGAVGAEYPAGRFELDGTRLIVSRGVGSVEMPLRVFAPADVVVVDLVARESEP